MSQTFLDPQQVVGYDFENKKLVVCLTQKMALKMIADGWKVGHDDEVGYFIHISLM
jgi:hypothetical protein